MHIEHITYDECRKPASTAKRAREFLSSKLGRHSDDPSLSVRRNERATRLVTAWPTLQPEVVKGFPGVRIKSCESPKNVGDGEMEKSIFRRSLTPLRRKSSSADSRDKELGGAEEWRDVREKGIERVRSIRKEIREGRLELAVPPADMFRRERRSAPLIPPTMRTATPPLETKENYLYGARTDNSGLLPSDDALNRTFSSLLRRSVPVPEIAPDTHLQTPADNRSQISSSSTYSEEITSSGQQANLARKGHNLWRPGPLDPCRLCKKGSVVGIRGLCRECEEDFVRPESPFFNPQNSCEDDVKPPPPLKTAGTLAGKRSASRRGRGRKDEDEDEKRSACFYEFWEDILRAYRRNNW
jgi:hypothetical protein